MELCNPPGAVAGVSSVNLRAAPKRSRAKMLRRTFRVASYPCSVPRSLEIGGEAPARGSGDHRVRASFLYRPGVVGLFSITAPALRKRLGPGRPRWKMRPVLVGFSECHAVSPPGGDRHQPRVAARPRPLPGRSRLWKVLVMERRHVVGGKRPRAFPPTSFTG